MANKKKYYVVWQGKTPGIYETWEDCKAQVHGFDEAKYKSFPTKEEAEAAFKGNFAKHIYSKTSAGKNSSSKIQGSKSEVIWNSLSVDAACSGNPGLMEYQGVHTTTRQQVFHQKFALGTNNIGEFLAIVHALAMFQKKGDQKTPIYTDSRTALAWVRNKKCKSNLERDNRTENLWQIVERAENWLKTNKFSNPILKWETEEWGEIPADFGRK